MNLTLKTIGNVTEKLNEYLKPYVCVMDKPRRKVLPFLMEGMLASGSCLIAESVREVNPEHLETTERRFLRTLASPHWDETELWVTHLKETAKAIKPDTMITLDISDLAKPHALKLEALATVRDGSKKTLTKGYWMFAMTAALVKDRILPIVHEVFSQESDEFRSQNDILFFWVKGLLHLTDQKGLYVIDRGGDGDPIFNFFLDEKAKFLIRLTGNRILLSEGKPVIFSDIPSKLPFGLRKILKKHHSNITFDWQRVTLPHRTEKLTLITVRGSQDRKPMFLLTNQSVSSRQEIAFLIDRYFRRWEIEESFRFLKQAFRLEKFLIRGFRAIQRFYFLLCIAWGFLTSLMRFKRIRKLIEAVSFSFKRKLDFFYYRWLRGLQFLFSLIHTFRFLEVI